MKKYTSLLFIPLLGAFYVGKAISEEKLFENPFLYFGSSIYQGICLGLFMTFLTGFLF